MQSNSKDVVKLLHHRSFLPNKIRKENNIKSKIITKVSNLYLLFPVILFRSCNNSDITFNKQMIRNKPGPFAPFSLNQTTAISTSSDQESNSFWGESEIKTPETMSVILPKIDQDELLNYTLPVKKQKTELGEAVVTENMEVNVNGVYEKDFDQYFNYSNFLNFDGNMFESIDGIFTGEAVQESFGLADLWSFDDMPVQASY